jgi:membrane associated rhomboid family serine protease
MESNLRASFRWIVGFLASLWIVFGLEYLIPTLVQWGLIPRTIMGLPGIASMVFLHGGLGHLISNSIPLVVLLSLLALSRSDMPRIVIAIQIGAGLLLWIVGRPSIHIGASVLVYGLIAFLIAAGYFERRLASAAIALVVLFLYGGSLLWGVLPMVASHVSWEGHLCGAIVGGWMGSVQAANGSADKKRIDAGAK